ncbi:transient receptor potential cation channel protein painless [Anopheles darlingi]|uniref:Transient receptor potential cation channel protein painless n=1 Tax=Anopheles darlingi TaxID=43151 RepID=W5J852_ANODA|nr:transient receptor potential cation channel protein painless [Anopheles darlingi]
MFMRVLYTFCESLIPFLTVIMGCLLSFHILFRDTNKNESASQDQNTTQAAQNVCEEGNTSDEFQTIEGTSRKVFIMMAGDLNTEKLDFQTVPRVVMFFLFVVIIVIVWNNFMNSLAVDDTMGMRAKSQFLAIKQDVIFMQRLETILKIMERYRISRCSLLVIIM